MMVTSAFLCLHIRWEHATSMNVTCRFTLLSPAKSAFKFGTLTSCTFSDQDFLFSADSDPSCEIAVAIRTPKPQVAEKVGIVIGGGKTSLFSWSLVSNKKFARKNESKNPASIMKESVRLRMMGTPALRRMVPRMAPRPVHNNAGVIYPARKNRRKAQGVSRTPVRP